MTHHFIDLWRHPKDELRDILNEAHSRKKARNGAPKGRADMDAPLKDRTLAMIFEKNSTRTRFSFDMAIRQLGGSSIVVAAGDMQLGRGESVEDTAKVLSRYVDAIMIRANKHAALEEFAKHSTAPVVNGLTNKSHPCQIMADLQTLEERGIVLKDSKIAWVGDGNNVCASFIHAAPKFGYRLAVGCPPQYDVDMADVERARAEQGRVEIFRDAAQAVADADVIVADTWVSMGDLDENERLAGLAPFQVNRALMDKAKKDALFLHCLPAHRGEEVTADIIDGPQSVIYDEAENRLHAQKAILKWCLEA
ncbi:MAG: ornithine carbamoyltransferase [Caulobacterales bacterium]